VLSVHVDRPRIGVIGILDELGECCRFATNQKLAKLAKKLCVNGKLGLAQFKLLIYKWFSDGISMGFIAVAGQADPLPQPEELLDTLRWLTAPSESQEADR